MIKKKFYIIFVLVIFLSILSITNVSAFFFLSHEKWVIQGFDEIDSPFTKMCRPFLSVTINGDLSSDSGVIYYSDSNDLNRKSYIYPHTLQGYRECMKDAGSDIGSKCFCGGNYLHILQDSYSHNIGGLVEQGLRTYLGNNYFGHMTLEKNYENIHMEQLQKSNPSLYSKVNDFDKKVLNDLMTTDSSGKLTAGGKYLELLNSMSGIDMGSSVDTIRRGYLGVGFYDSVYADKISLPLFPYIIIPGVMIGLSLIIIILLFIFGRTKWKWFSIFLFLIILFAGSYVFYSFYTGNSWKVINYIIEIPPKFGYLGISQSQVDYYDKLVQRATNDFLADPSIADGVSAIQDASGLSYKDASGIFHDGVLEKAESGYKYFLFPLLSVLIIFYVICLMLKSFGLRPANKFFRFVVNWVTYSGTTTFFSLLAMIIYGIFF